MSKNNLDNWNNDNFNDYIKDHGKENNEDEFDNKSIGKKQEEKEEFEGHSNHNENDKNEKQEEKEEFEGNSNYNENDKNDENYDTIEPKKDDDLYYKQKIGNNTEVEHEDNKNIGQNKNGSIVEEEHKSLIENDNFKKYINNNTVIYASIGVVLIVIIILIIIYKRNKQKKYKIFTRNKQGNPVVTTPSEISDIKVTTTTTIESNKNEENNSTSTISSLSSKDDKEKNSKTSSPEEPPSYDNSIMPNSILPPAPIDNTYQSYVYSSDFPSSEVPLQSAADTINTPPSTLPSNNTYQNYVYANGLSTSQIQYSSSPLMPTYPVNPNCPSYYNPQASAPMANMISYNNNAYNTNINNNDYGYTNHCYQNQMNSSVLYCDPMSIGEQNSPQHQQYFTNTSYTSIMKTNSDSTFVSDLNHGSHHYAITSPQFYCSNSNSNMNNDNGHGIMNQENRMNVLPTPKNTYKTTMSCSSCSSECTLYQSNSMDEDGMMMQDQNNNNNRMPLNKLLYHNLHMKQNYSKDELRRISEVEEEML